MDEWKKECQKKSRWDYYPKEPSTFWKKYRQQLTGATIHETMGPNWKPIVWFAGRPHVFK